ncbi:MAG: DUF4160 domain-containing protein [Candidatus Gracilibacteria bacterium]|nr:DUF4160 domain-containing protein [Candidatus Gracilibacteria bacterium]
MKITTGIASTTHVDRHNERMAKSALDSMAEQIKERFIPQLIEHDPNQHIGVILYGEVFQLNDGEYALGIVSGLFENEQEKKNHKTGESNKVWQDHEKYLNIDELVKMNERNHQTIRANSSRKLNIADLLEKHLDSTQVLPDGTVYKIKRFITSMGDLKIEVYAKDHMPNPDHFHVISKQRKINARFDIKTLNHVKNKQGSISSNDIKKIQNFFNTHPEMLEFLKNEHTRLSN